MLEKGDHRRVVHCQAGLVIGEHKPRKPKLSKYAVNLRDGCHAVPRVHNAQSAHEAIRIFLQCRGNVIVLLSAAFYAIGRGIIGGRGNNGKLNVISVHPFQRHFRRVAAIKVFAYVYMNVNFLCHSQSPTFPNTLSKFP